MKRHYAIILMIVLSLALAACAPATAATTPGTGDKPATQQASDPIQGVEDVLAVLGVFSAFMLVLALGTEAVIDAFKLLIGFKSKPTALEALSQMQTWLPQQVKELGAGEETLQQLSQTLDKLSHASLGADQYARAGVALNKWLLELSVTFKTRPPDPNTLKTSLAALEKHLKAEGVQDKYIQDMKDWALSTVSTFYISTIQQLVAHADPLLLEIGLSDEKKRKAAVKILETWLLHYVPRLVGMLFSQGAQQQAAGMLAQQMPNLTEAFTELEKLLDNILSADQLNQLKNRLLAMITAIQSSTASGAQSAINTLLQAVEQRRELIQSPLRKVWRWIKARLNIHFSLEWKVRMKKSGAWGRFRLWLANQLEATLSLKPERQLINTNQITLAGTLLLRNDAQRDEELSRLRWLRLVSILVGFGLALWLQIDAGRLLADILPPQVLASLTASLGTLNGLPVTPGIILSALAASAGASFWHDILDRLQTSKKAVGEVKDLLDKLRQMESNP